MNIKQLLKTKDELTEKLNENEENIYKHFENIYKDFSVITKEVITLENSKDYFINEYSDVYKSIDSSGLLDSIPENEREHFARYLDEYFCITVDYKQSTLIQFLGPISEELIICESNYNSGYSVWHNRKELISSRSFEECKTFAKDWSEENGYYPHLFSMDHCGHIDLIKY